MKFKIMTWNVENLFPPGEGTSPAPVAYKAKLKNLAATITTLAPELLALQEVGSPAAIHDLQKDLAGAYPHAAISNAPDERGIRVAVLSKLALQSPEDLVDFAEDPSVTLADGSGQRITKMRRGALCVRVHVGGKPLHIVTAHLKSKLLSYPGDGFTAFSTRDEGIRARVASLALAVRTAEAVTVRNKATEILTNKERLIVLGDLNDVPEAATTEILYGPPGSQPGTKGFDQGDDGDTQRLFNLCKILQANGGYTRINNGVHEIIDHVLVSAQLVPAHGGKRDVPEVKSYPQTEGGHIGSVSGNPNSRRDEPVSDHAPVTAQFAF